MNKLNESEVDSLRKFTSSDPVIFIEAIEMAFDISNKQYATIK